MQTVKFHRENAGCYADHVHGWNHVRDVLRGLVESLPDESPEKEEIVEALQEEASDDAWEEYAAVDLLNEYCDEGCYWIIDQDLFLVDSGKDEEDDDDDED